MGVAAADTLRETMSKQAVVGKRNRWLRVVLAFLLAPLLLPILVVGWEVWSAPSELANALALGVIITILTYGVTLLPGMPIFGILVWRRWTALFPAALAGALIGTTISPLFIAVMDQALGTRPATTGQVVWRRVTESPMLLVVPGCIGTLIAGIIWRAACPDRREES
jgi:hypothetical protein